MTNINSLWHHKMEPNIKFFVSLSDAQEYREQGENASDQQLDGQIPRDKGP